MAVNTRLEGGVVVLSQFARLMNDPRHFDAGRDVRALLDEGHRAFVLELTGLREIGPGGLGLLTTLTRLVRRHGGDAVLARASPEVGKYLDEMRMDAFWDSFPTVAEARAFLLPRPGLDDAESAGGKNDGGPRAEG